MAIWPLCGMYMYIYLVRHVARWYGPDTLTRPVERSGTVVGAQRVHVGSIERNESSNGNRSLK